MFAARAVKEERLRSDLAEALGGKLGDLIERDDVAEVDINVDGAVWVDWLGDDGGRRPFDYHVSEQEAESIAIAIAQLSGEQLTEEQDDLVTKLPLRGKAFARVSLHCPPATERYTVCARKHTGVAIDLRVLVKNGILDEDHFEAIVEAQRERLNCATAGEMFAGKTTFQNGILGIVAEVDPGRRYGYVEVVPETVCPLENHYPVRTSRFKTERDRIRELMTRNLNAVSNAETKSASAVDLIDAWNSHAGGHTTAHAGTAHGLLWRLDSLHRQAGIEPPRELIASAVNFVVVIAYREGVGRRVIEVARVRKQLDAMGEYQLDYIGARYRFTRGAFEPV